MNDTKKHIAEVLKRGMKGEEDGRFFYNLLAQKATNPEAKRKLENLRDDEVRHKETLRRLYEQHIGGEVGELPTHGLTALSEVFERGRVERHRRVDDLEFDLVRIAERGPQR